MKRIFQLLVLCLLSQGTNSFAQKQTPSSTPTPSSQDEVVVINTSLIQFDATVTDKNGKAVKDLTADDFEVFENNNRQTITNLSFVDIQPGFRPGQPLTAKEGEGNVPIVPGGLMPTQVRRTIALVVDDLGLSFGSTVWAKRALGKFVDEQIQTGDLVAIIRTSSGVGALQQFTTDRRLLHAAIDRIRYNAHGTGAFSPIEPTLSEYESNVVDRTGPSRVVRQVAGVKEERENMRDAEDTRDSFFTAGTLGAVNFVMRGMGQIPGRKAVILISDGFKLFGRTGLNTRVQESLQQLTDTANRSGVIIYSMDARGLDVPMLTAEDNTIGLTTGQVDMRLEERRLDFFDTQQSLRYIAAQTGGFSIINQNDLSKGIERILDDQKGYYLIGYQPHDDIFDIEKRRFNKLTVKVTRPGLHIRYRSGFFGMTDAEAKPRPRNAVQQLISALTSPFTVKDIDLRLTALFAGDAASGSFMRSLIYIKASDLKFTEEKEGWYKSEFDISVLTFGDNGEVVDQMNRKQTVRARADYLKALNDNGLVAQVTLPIQKPGAYQMRVALRDSETGRMGSASQYIEVPNLKKKNLTLSGIVLERVDAKKEGQIEDTKTLELKLQRDAAMRRFRAGQTVRFGLSVYNAKSDKESRKSNLLIQYKIFRDNKEIFASQPKPLNDQVEAARVIDASQGFALGGKMQQGDYLLEVIVTDSLAKGSRAVATQWTDFEIVP
ncbi:MAG: VWA domain-containing protein [bacterium]